MTTFYESNLVTEVSQCFKIVEKSRQFFKQELHLCLTASVCERVYV